MTLPQPHPVRPTNPYLSAFTFWRYHAIQASEQPAPSNAGQPTLDAYFI